ncbi:hypothetical protein BRE01_24480 [Brevibacillus reuszeri]|uniref:Glutaredoxin n=1 Tax=Brevibacillus reuszeri TaxID=54915 RepID=A0A0K9YMD4_9BACL|nr:thioredoxin family protein [Brevibacillus reuszeri]KNB69903.1 hypothetical protein ADS79_29130 [Brevibacillus reuszeri]MED1858258.1 thioredoxin family protein [Brevibacillus reuszeri]GED68746.1 hypothetical protein BRE01_24480 [Brevibacillus reuszeri]
MSQQVAKLMLFTLSACPMGRSIHTVLGEVLTVKKGIVYEIVSIDADHETTNRYKIKANPTTLFLAEDGQELYRFEGFKETAEVLSLFEPVEEGALPPVADREENRQTEEVYTVYLYDAEQIVPIEMTYHNLTSIKAPRITAIQQLLRAQREGLENPFSAQSSLETVSFQNQSGVVTLRSDGKVSASQSERMRILLAHTLAVYGVSEVALKWV